MKTPIHPNTSLGLNDYRQMIRSMLYLTTSKLYIMYDVYLRERFQSDPREVHLSVVKHIF